MAFLDSFCWHCVSGLWANDRFCRKCGEDLDRRVPLGQEPVVEPEVTSKLEPEVTSKLEPEVAQLRIPTGTLLEKGFLHSALSSDGQLSSTELPPEFIIFSKTRIPE